MILRKPIWDYRPNPRAPRRHRDQLHLRRSIPVGHSPQYLLQLDQFYHVGRGKKRKFEFDTTEVERLTREAEEDALLRLEKEQAEALRAKLPDFWLPSLTPTYTSKGPPRSLTEIKLQTTCRGGNPSHKLSYVARCEKNYLLSTSLVGRKTSSA